MLSGYFAGLGRKNARPEIDLLLQAVARQSLLNQPYEIE